MEMKRRFVILDRDGTIIDECSYLDDPRQVKLIAGAAEALRRLRSMGLGLAVVTNQSAVGRGLINEERLNEIHRRLVEILNSEGVQLDGLYYCPHKPDDQCWCRKPRTGLIERAADELSFDLAETFVVGDKASDIEMGRRAGAVTFLVRTGYGTEAAGDPAAAPDHVVADLAEAAEKIAALLDDRR